MRERGLTKQVQDCLDSKLRIGHSKYQDKRQGITQDYIYSWSTYRTYLKHSCYFVKWAREQYGVKNLDSARPYVNDFLRMRMEQKVSPYTQKLEASALAKLYGCTTEDFIKTEVRHRRDISRSRGEKVRDKHFSEENNKEFVSFCRATGLRRSELVGLTKQQLKFDSSSGRYYLQITGKGGRYREAPVLTDEAVRKIQNSGSRVFDKLPNGADIHGYRAEYATAIYNQHARELTDIPKPDRYICRGDLLGIVYDKKAMQLASIALGHNRISIIAAHYIRRD